MSYARFVRTRNNHDGMPKLDHCGHPDHRSAPVKGYRDHRKKIVPERRPGAAALFGATAEHVETTAISAPVSHRSRRNAGSGPLRVLALTRYGRLGASSRLRFYQLAPGLATAGISVEIVPLFDDGYLRSLYKTGRRPATLVLAGYAARLARLLLPGLPSLLWVEKEVLPWLPGWLERLLLGRGLPLIVDYDDATFHRYDQHASGIIRHALGGKVARVMAGAEAVIAGNEYIAAYAQQAGARRIVVQPTPIDPLRYPIRTGGPPPVFRVVWIGSPMTSGYLDILRRPLQRLSREDPLEILLIGAARSALDGLPVRRCEWSEAGEGAAIAQGSVGVMPLPDGPWERGKCGYKLIQYMACGLPVVASPVGGNAQLVEPDRNGLLATTPDDWYSALSLLRREPARGSQMGLAGRGKVQEGYSTQTAVARLADLFADIARAPSRTIQARGPSLGKQAARAAGSSGG
jgi:glycosyltransferase involved in cell wall biosynthesis